jgi:hypothetical protein
MEKTFLSFPELPSFKLACLNNTTLESGNRKFENELNINILT